MSDLQFKAVLLEISNQLSPDELKNLKFLCGNIGKRDLEKINTGIGLFQIMTQRCDLTTNNTKYLSDLLKQIQRPDLVEKLNNFEIQAEDSDQADEAERAKLDSATGVIAENLGKPWRKLGRKLGLSEVKLESIYKKHPTDLEETVMELLKEWRKSRGAEAKTKELIEALRACQFNLTADKVEDKLKAVQ
ncbi:hypothetical protein PAMP_000979 [Pampus punctatissimus]